MEHIIGEINLLKPNGAVVDGYFMTMNESGVTARIGITYRSLKPFVARLRVKNDSVASDNWLTIVPITQKTRVPFGWGATVTPARISADNGVGGTIEPKASIFHSITLPKGKWSISMGLKLPEGESSNLIGSIDLLDAQGLTTKSNFVDLNESGNQARKETIITITKPTPVLLRVENSNSVSYEYDVTIAKEE